MVTHTFPAGSRRAFDDRAFLGIAAILAFGTYFVVFRLTGSGTAVDDAFASLRNFIPLALLTLAVRPVLLRHVRHLAPTSQLAAHLALGTAFSALWYWLLMVMIGLWSGGGLTSFEVRPFFDDPAFAWQMLQGAAAYTAITAVTFMRETEREAALPSPPSSDTTQVSQKPSLQRYLVRRGEDIMPVDVGDIIAIEGADDYAEVVSASGRHLVRATLAALENSLDGSSFVRVHRSRIINLRRLVRAEPAGGGRLLLHMENGHVVHSSRAGARAMRELTI
ncbi:MAG TPA: LytTR family DNA-binding domain-containing protein [Allosphingosinicella sp.]|jgi:hypothetical protein|nr:LytTR family DNA-binding domain-containing protein [Allosphingosinicella sp.]